MEISALPDGDLLTVLSFLNPDDLLLCRAVCRRWASLAGHPSLWGKLGIPEMISKKMLRAVLRFAPCLHFLIVRLSPESTDDLWSTLISTSCVISKIQLSFDLSDAALAALSISRQASLGRLKFLKVEMFGELAPDASPALGRGLCALLLQICHTKGLEDLDVLAHLAPSAAKCLEGLDCTTVPVPPSLKKMLFMGPLDHFRDLVLQWHADTLEEVFIKSASARVAPLLSSMPRLRKLACAPFEGMRALLQCPALRTLYLAVSEHLPSEAVSYVTEAARTQLEHLRLALFTATSEPIRGLFLGLDGPDEAGATLRSLKLNLYGEPCPCRSLYQEPLAGVLHRLPLLRLLDLDDEPTPALLRALDGRAVPELRELRVRLLDDYSLGCEHHFIESEEVRGLMRRYPRLHVVMKDVQFAKDCEAAFCRDVDREHCYSRCVLYSHEAAARCDVSHRGFEDDDEEGTCCVAFHVATA